MRQKWYVFASILSIVLLLGIYQWYSSFISQSIYEESIEHLQEIYTQVDRTFASLVVKNWKLLDCCSPREVCEQRGDAPYSSCGNTFDGEPDCPMAAHIKPRFI